VNCNVQLAEFDLRKAVLPSPVVLKQATVNAGSSTNPIPSSSLPLKKRRYMPLIWDVLARVVGKEGKLGVIKQGAFADFLLLSGNPLEDVGILNKPGKYLRAVVKDGRCVRSRVDGLKVEISLV
jgi:predicted amidohydrolase YtcJ